MAKRNQRNNPKRNDDELEAEANRGYRGGHLSRGNIGNRGALGAGYIDPTSLSAGNLIGGGNNAGFGAGGNWYTSDPTLDGYSGTLGDETDLAGYGSLRPVHAGRGSKNYKRSDARIEEDVHEALLRDPYLDATDVDVKVESGEVTLYGEVPDRNQRRRAEECVERCAGVRDVHNNLKARQPLWGANAGRTNAESAERDVTAAPQRDASGRSQTPASGTIRSGAARSTRRNG